MTSGLRFQYLAGICLLNIVYSMYVVVSRPLYGADVYGEWFVFYLVSAEYIPSLMAFALGSLSDAIGRRRVMSVSIMGAFFIFMLFQIENWIFKIVFVFLYSFTHTLAITIGLSYVIEDRANVGRKYSKVGVASGLGWGIGSLIAWPLLSLLSMSGFPSFVSIIYVAGIIFLITGYSGKEREQAQAIMKGLSSTINNLRSLIPIILLSYIGLTIGGTYNSILMDKKITAIINNSLDATHRRFLYGVLYGFLPVLAGTPLRPFIGRIVDYGKAREAFLAALLSYLILFVVLPFTPPLIFFLLWILPVYPFFDTSLYAMVSRGTTGYEASVSGFLSTISSISGVVILILNTLLDIEKSNTYLTLVSLSFLTASILTKMVFNTSINTYSTEVETAKKRRAGGGIRTRE